MIFEIRSYHFQPRLFEAYKAWAKKEALPYLRRKVHIVGFWVTTKDAPDIKGVPEDRLGAANIIWIIEWRDLSQRNEIMPKVLSSPEWMDLFSRVPGGAESYLRKEVKFAESFA